MIIISVVVNNIENFFLEIHELQTELDVIEASDVTNFGTRCTRTEKLITQTGV